MATASAPTAGGGGEGDHGAGTSGGGGGGGDDAHAGFLGGARPAYPAEARRAGMEGVVTLRILVAPDGTAASVTVRQSSGFTLLDTAAAESVKSWRFAPARRAGVPIAGLHDVRIRFRLSDPA